MTWLRRLWDEEEGLILSAELVLVLTIGVLAMVVGLNSVASSLNQELNDVAGAFGAVDQTYAYSGFYNPMFSGRFGGAYGLGFGGTCSSHAFVSGGGYIDTADLCDCSEIVPVGGGIKADGAGGGSEGGAALGGTTTTSSSTPIEVETTTIAPEPEPHCAACEQ